MHQVTPLPSPPRTGGARQTPASLWITAATSAPPTPAPLSATTGRAGLHEVVLTGPPAPQRAVPAPPPGTALSCHLHRRPARVWCLGVHGGSGESTVAALMEGSRESGHAWPDLAGDPAPVVLIARTSAHGLERSQAAAAQWAAGATSDVRLLGLVLIADAPGRLPPPLHAWVKVLSGGVPRVWHLPWSEELRRGADPRSARHSRAVRRLLGDVAALLPLDPSPATEEVPHASRAAAHG